MADPNQIIADYTAKHGGLKSAPYKSSPDRDENGRVVQDPVYHYEFGDGTSLDMTGSGSIKSSTESKAPDAATQSADNARTSALTDQTVEQTAALQATRKQREKNQAAGKGYLTDAEVADLDNKRTSQGYDASRIANETRSLEISARNAGVNESNAALAARRLELEQIVQADSTKLDWAKLEYQKAKDDNDRAVRERDSALNERQQGETERANQATEKYRQDSLAGTAREGQANREAEAARSQLASQTSLATEASRAMTASLPFIAPKGTNDDLAALRNSLSTGAPPPITPSRSTPFPFDPRMIAQQVMGMGNGQFVAPTAPLGPPPIPQPQPQGVM